MQHRMISRAALALVIGLAFVPGVMAEDAKESGKSSAMSAEEMKALEKMGTVGDNHKLLSYMQGYWKTKTTHFGEDGKPTESDDGTCNTKVILDGKFYQADHSSTMMGQPMRGTAISGYDTIAEKFVGTWIDNFSTHIMYSTGSYDPGTKTFTYVSEMADPVAPETKVTITELVKVIDNNKHSIEFFMKKKDKNYKFMDITYSRANPAG